MAVINLGQMGTQRSGALDLSSIGERSKALAEAKTQEAEAEEARTAKTREYLREAYKNYWKQPDRERQLFDNTPEGKQFHKVAKKYITDWYDKEGKPIRYPVEKEPYEPKSREEQIQLKADTEEAIGKVKNNLPLTAKDAANITNAVDIMIYRKAIPEETGKAILEKVSTLLKNKFTGALGAGEGEVDPASQDPFGLLGGQ